MKNLLFLSAAAFLLFSCADSNLQEKSGTDSKLQEKSDADSKPQEKKAPISKSGLPASKITAGVCHDSGEVRPCTKEEQEMIDGINKIIKELRDFDQKSLKTDFIQATHGEDPKVLIFGEDHLATMGKVKTLAAINSLAKKDDIVLLEGNDRREPRFKNCLMFLMFQIYTEEQYKKSLNSARDYDANSAYKFKNEKHDLFNATILVDKNKMLLNYNLSGLRGEDLRCYFWDKINPEANDPSWAMGRSGMQERNQSMVEAIKARKAKGIKAWTAKGHRVFINTGYGHMPLGELLQILMKNQLDINNFMWNEKALEFFYSLIESFKIKPEELANMGAENSRNVKISDFMFNEKTIELFYSLIESSESKEWLAKMGIDFSKITEGASKVLWEYLKTIPHSQFIHERMLFNPYENF